MLNLLLAWQRFYRAIALLFQLYTSCWGELSSEAKIQWAAAMIFQMFWDGHSVTQTDHAITGFYPHLNGAWLLVCGLVKRPGKATPNQLSNNTLRFHQITYQKPYPILIGFRLEVLSPSWYGQVSIVCMVVQNKRRNSLGDLPHWVNLGSVWNFCLILMHYIWEK